MTKNYTLITGACGGLGKSFVKILAENGENLILVGTSEEKLKKLTKDFENEFKNISILTFICDLSKKDDRLKLVNFVSEKGISIVKLINNAGVIIEGDLEKFSNDQISNAIEVNCVGTLELTKSLIEIRDSQKKFEVLTVASQAAFQPIPHMAVYAATKSFLVSMMTALKVEYKGKNVVFTTVCPSGMATTQAMKDSIASMGINGKLTTVSTDKVARVALKALRKKKAIVIPGFFNKFVAFISKLFSPYFLAKTTGKIWKKSQDKRGF